MVEALSIDAEPFRAWRERKFQVFRQTAQYHQAMEHIRGKLGTGVRTISTASCVDFMPGNAWGGRSQQAEDPLDSPRISVRTRRRAAA